MKRTLLIPMLAFSFLTPACDDAAPSPSSDAGPAGDVHAVDALPATDSADAEGPAGDVGPGVLGIVNLNPYQVVEGVVTVEVTTGPVAPSYISLVVEGVEVARADSAPFSLRWDTTRHEDKLTWLRLETADEQSETLTVMVLNQGQPISFASTSGRAGAGESAEGSFEALAGGTFDPAGVDFQWELPAGFRAIVMLLLWDNEAFEMQFEVGQGEDHTSGSFAVGGSSNYSPSNIWYSLTHRSTALAPGACYVYVSPKEVQEAIPPAEKSGFRLQGYLLR